MHPRLRNVQLLDGYEELVKTVNCEPGEPQILGSIFIDEISLIWQLTRVSVANTQVSKSKSK